jgi:hypothetical protein
MTNGASYSFLSVLRRGLAALIPASVPTAGQRVAVPVSLSVGGSPASGLPTVAVRGPGDVIGFDGSAVRRTWPAGGADQAEPSYFALLEFGDSDLPWRYSPAATAGDRLVPWLCLIVLEDGEVASETPAGPGRPLAAVTVTDAAALPDLSQAWAWAHAQILGLPTPPAADFDAAAVAALLAQDPARLLARVLCPRQLHPLMNYRAYLVPTFERGRLSGLGQPPGAVGRLAPAWQTGQASVELPVYYAWSFRTGEAGDFASLVAKLQPVGELPVQVWQRDLAVSPPGAAPPEWQVADLASALIPLGAAIPDWPSIDARGFTAALAARTNAGGAVLAPPLYGRWLAAAAALSTAATATPPWFHQLNADPRVRIAAGLGTLVVQTEQQQLLAGAWAQVDGIRAANERLRLAQLARELAQRLYVRHISAVDEQSRLEVTAPLHDRVRVGTGTAGAQLAATAIADGVLAPAWRRVSRPLGTLGVRQGRPAVPPAAPGQGSLARMNTGALAIAPGPPPSSGTAPTGAMQRLGDLSVAFTAAHVTPENLHTIAAPGGFTVQPPPVFAAPAVEAVPGPGIPPVRPPVQPPAGPPVQPPVQPPAGPPVQPPAGLAPATTGFIDAASALMLRLALPRAAGTTWVQADLDVTRSAIAATLDPVATIQAPLVSRLTGVTSGPRRVDPIEPVMAAPEFPQPMYAALAAAGREWLLPGLDAMPSDAVALFATNWRFVESFLVGLNHELARKLLWNGYPTDQRGSYFRRFWDALPGAPADVGPLHQWTGALGANELSPADPLVLLVRGELIRRYPNVIVYAAQAVLDGQGRAPGPNESQPIFFGRVGPDIALFGFDVDPVAARGDPGWFFVLQEHPSEPRFGLAAPGTAFGAQPSTWQALGWDHMAASAQDLAALRYIDLGAALPQAPVTPDPAGAVWHAAGTPPSRSADIAHITLRQPKRLAVHGSVLIAAPPAKGGNA